MSYTIKRLDKNGGQQVVACVDDLTEVGAVIDADRAAIDWEAGYMVENDEVTHDAK